MFRPSLKSNLKYLDVLELQDYHLFTLLFLNKLEQIVGFINIVFLHLFFFGWLKLLFFQPPEL